MAITMALDVKVRFVVRRILESVEMGVSIRLLTRNIAGEIIGLSTNLLSYRGQFTDYLGGHLGSDLRKIFECI